MPPFGNLQTIGNDENVFTVTFDPTRLANDLGVFPKALM
jgi:hypothetical protein